MKSEIINLRIDGDLLTELRMEAAKRETSVSILVREAVKEMLGRKSEPVPFPVNRVTPLKPAVDEIDGRELTPLDAEWHQRHNTSVGKVVNGRTVNAEGQAMIEQMRQRREREGRPVT